MTELNQHRLVRGLEGGHHYLEGAMNNAYSPALAALAGSAISALASCATTWLTQHSQGRAQRYAQAMTLPEQLYGGFIEEASKLFTDALTHELGDPSIKVSSRLCNGREIATLCLA